LDLAREVAGPVIGLGGDVFLVDQTGESEDAFVNSFVNSRDVSSTVLDVVSLVASNPTTPDR